MILDEPSTYIDKRFEARLYELLAEINKECAIILVSHDIGTVLQQVKSIACVMKRWITIRIQASLPNGWKKLQLPYRAIGTRYIASPGFRRASSPSLNIDFI